MNNFPASELILNNDGSVYHLHLLPNDIADTIITVGDPDRVDKIAKHLKNIRVKKKNREFYTITGEYNSKEISIISTGIGTDNIDIVFNELNILTKIDLIKKQYYPKPRILNIIRIGTSGTLRSDIALGTMLISEYAIGLEGLMNFYDLAYTDEESSMNIAVSEKIKADFPFLNPYTIASSQKINSVLKEAMVFGITATCQGFYHPQGRFLWSENNVSILNTLSKININEKVVSNFEMETSGILGLARFFGHEASSVSLILANRITNKFINDAEKKMEEMIVYCLEKISTI